MNKHFSAFVGEKEDTTIHQHWYAEKWKVFSSFHFEKSLLENHEKSGLFYVQLLKDFRFTANIQNRVKERSVTGFYL